MKTSEQEVDLPYTCYGTIYSYPKPSSNASESVLNYCTGVFILHRNSVPTELTYCVSLTYTNTVTTETTSAFKIKVAQTFYKMEYIGNESELQVKRNVMHYSK